MRVLNLIVVVRLGKNGLVLVFVMVGIIVDWGFIYYLFSLF